MATDSDRSSFYIDGAWAEATGRERIVVQNPATEQPIGTVPSGTAEDVDRAVAAARQALVPWVQRDRADRFALLDRLQAELTLRADDVVATITAEMGAPTALSRNVQTGLGLTDVAMAAEAGRAQAWEEEIGNSRVLNEPLGVVGAITPWNYPLHQVTAKLAYALAAGCTVVLKPSELTPLTAYLLFDALDAAGFPPGVVNLVTGYGATVGEAIAAHPDIDMVSFTGSTRAGTRVAELASASVKKVALELGGKGANVILPGADLARAVKVGVGNCFLNSGQTCTAWTRMLVHESQYDEAVVLARVAAEKYTTGDPLDPGTRLGPLVSAAQRERVLGYVGQGVAAGAQLVTGGTDERPGTGYFVAPTVFADVSPDMTIAQEEIFGPVLSILPFRSEDEAVRVANDSAYGLSGAVWAADREEAIAVARRMDVGQIDINGGAFNPAAPFGGYKRSGVGRELGRYGLHEFLQQKSLQL
jgi:aldehyde dehydrogenase (NAD+)